EGETRVIRITAYRWFSIGLEFQVEFADDDILWQPLSTVKECAALDVYLTQQNVRYPSQLSKSGACLPRN
ncbi:hypothetical protein R3P38DRAFT_2543869, partial [Favolaschia claudopus]